AGLASTGARRRSMLLRSIRALALLAALLPFAGAAAQDLAKYPDWKGQWERIGDARWDIGKPRLAQDAPLTTEYAPRLTARIAEQSAAGPGNDLMYKCTPPGMPRMMLGYNPLEFIVTRSLTYVALEHMGQVRRIFTDGRDWPASIEPTYVGYSIGNWI